jgi:signal peptidase II
MMRLPHRARVFWPVFVGWVAADYLSKRAAESRLAAHIPTDVIGPWVRFTLTYNTGAAMNISVGDASRVVFTVLALLMIAVILGMYRRTPPHETAQPVALALIAGGALGNLLDRVRSVRGVVDFIDVGIGDSRFWTFNVADAGVTCGAVLLMMVLWSNPATAESEGEVRRERRDETGEAR